MLETAVCKSWLLTLKYGTLISYFNNAHLNFCWPISIINFNNIVRSMLQSVQFHVGSIFEKHARCRLMMVANVENFTGAWSHASSIAKCNKNWNAHSFIGRKTDRSLHHAHQIDKTNLKYYSALCLKHSLIFKTDALSSFHYQHGAVHNLTNITVSTCSLQLFLHTTIITPISQHYDQGLQCNTGIHLLLKTIMITTGKSR
jgi:hypothetical protein